MTPLCLVPAPTSLFQPRQYRLSPICYRNKRKYFEKDKYKINIRDIGNYSKAMDKETVFWCTCSL